MTSEKFQTHGQTRRGLEEELERLDSQIETLRRTKANIVYDLEWKIKERFRLERRIRLLEQEDGAA